MPRAIMVAVDDGEVQFAAFERANQRYTATNPNRDMCVRTLRREPLACSRQASSRDIFRDPETYNLCVSSQLKRAHRFVVDGKQSACVHQQFFAGGSEREFSTVATK